VTVELGRPACLLLLTLIPVWLWWTRPRPERSLLLAYGTAAGAVALRSPLGVLIEWTPRLLRAAAFACLVVALSQPQSVSTYRQRVNDGVGIVFAIDLSTSMLAEDMAEGTNRLEAAKATILRFLKRRTDDVGLITFSGEALTRLPLTGDRMAMEAAVAGLETGLLRDGTDIAGATAAAGGLFRDAPHRSKVVILVTDGAHNMPGLDPAQAARAAAAYGVKVFAIAIGGDQTDDAEAQAMETVLAQTARITNAEYFRATDVSALDRIYAEIDRRTGARAARIVERTALTSIAFGFVIVALVLFLAGALLRGSRWGVVP
jgi:Ca-activated chloride channel family protein